MIKLCQVLTEVSKKVGITTFELAAKSKLCHGLPGDCKFLEKERTRNGKKYEIRNCIL